MVMFEFADSGRVESRSWSAVQSQTFSMYRPVADSVMCIDMNAPMQDEEAFELLLCAGEGDVVFQPGEVEFRKDCFQDVETVVLEVVALELGEATLLIGAGQSAFCRFDPKNPPILVWTSHMPDRCFKLAIFHSISTAPACGPWVEIIMSDHSTLPTSPGRPIWTTGLGWCILAKKGPLDMMTG